MLWFGCRLREGDAGVERASDGGDQIPAHRHRRHLTARQGTVRRPGRRQQNQQKPKR